MTRFFVEPAELASDSPVLTGENARHAKVLRLKVGEELLLCDGECMECLCAVEERIFTLKHDVVGIDILTAVYEG